MKTPVLVILCLFVFITCPYAGSAEPAPPHWYAIIVQTGNTVERFTGSSPLDPDRLEAELSGPASYVALENLREMVNRGEGPRWEPVNNGETLRVRSTQVLYFYILNGEPKNK